MWKTTLESWSFNIGRVEKILEIKIKNNQDCSRRLLKIEDTTGGHYGIVLETKDKKKPLRVYLEKMIMESCL